MLAERITALITVIQSFAFFPLPHPNAALVLSLFFSSFFFSLVSKRWSQTSYLHGAEVMTLRKSARCKKLQLNGVPLFEGGPSRGLHSRGGEDCGCLWWETSVCDMGALQRWGVEESGRLCTCFGAPSYNAYYFCWRWLSLFTPRRAVKMNAWSDAAALQVRYRMFL